jgi:hypothetical protein
MKKRLIKTVQLENSAKVIDVELYYSKGGLNYFSHHQEKRGLYLSVSPVEKGEFFTSYMAYTGTKQCVKEMNRFSQKVFNEYQPDDNLIQQMIDVVCNSNNLKVKSI